MTLEGPNTLWGWPLVLFRVIISATTNTCIVRIHVVWVVVIMLILSSRHVIIVSFVYRHYRGWCHEVTIVHVVVMIHRISHTSLFTYVRDVYASQQALYLTTPQWRWQLGQDEKTRDQGRPQC